MVQGLCWRVADLLTATLDFGEQDLGAESATTLDFVEQYLQLVLYTM